MIELNLTEMLKGIFNFFKDALKRSADDIDNKITFILQWVKDTLIMFFDGLWELLCDFVPASIGILADIALPVAQATNALLPDLSLFCGECFTMPSALQGLTGGLDSVLSTGILGFARWVLPIDIAICIMAVFTTVLLLYFTILPIFRWIKLVRA